MRRSPSTQVVAGLSFLALTLAPAGCSNAGPPSPMPTQSAESPSSTASSSASTGTGTPSPTPSSTASSTASASTSPTATAPVLTGFSLKKVSTPGYPRLGGDLGAVGAVRVGRHTGFDRVVWQFPGSGRPSFQVQYVAQPIGDGSGDVVKVRGAAHLEVLVSSVGIPAANAPRPGSASTASLAGTVVAEALPVYGGFEAVGQTFVGVRDRQRPFRVTVLTNPTRIVVDLASG